MCIWYIELLVLSMIDSLGYMCQFFNIRPLWFKRRLLDENPDTSLPFRINLRMPLKIDSKGIASTRGIILINFKFNHRILWRRTWKSRSCHSYKRRLHIALTISEPFVGNFIYKSENISKTAILGTDFNWMQSCLFTQDILLIIVVEILCFRE